MAKDNGLTILAPSQEGSGAEPPVKSRDALGHFIKGFPHNKGKAPWLKGKTGVYSAQTLEKKRLSALGKKLSEETKRKIGLAHKGIKLSDEWKRKIGDSNRGKKHKGNFKPNKGSFSKGITPWNKNKGGYSTSKKGMKLSEDKKKNMNLAGLEKGRAWNKGKKCPQFSGANNWNWKGGITPINQKIRHSLEYALWRRSVFERDRFTCVWCGAKSVKGKKVEIQADHIKPFAHYPELRFSIDNGRTYPTK
jgi:hypothetical protein